MPDMKAKALANLVKSSSMILLLIFLHFFPLSLSQGKPEKVQTNTDGTIVEVSIIHILHFSWFLKTRCCCSYTKMELA